MAHRPALSLCFLLLPSLAAAVEPVVLQHHGSLLDSQDRPVTSAVTLTVSLMKGQIGVDVVWTETFEVSPSQGRYSIALGDTTEGKKGLSADDVRGERWLAVKVNGAELKPRMRLGTVAQAIAATDADHLEGKTLADLDARYAPATGASYVQIQGATPGTPQTGHVNVTGTVAAREVVTTSVTTGTIAATTITGDGAGLTGLDASRLSTGTIADGRLAGTYSGVLTLPNAGNTISGNGAGLTGLNAGAIVDGTLGDGRLAGTYGSALALTNTGNTLVGNGAGLTALNAGALAAGTIPDARLAGTYGQQLALTNAANTYAGIFTGTHSGSFSGALGDVTVGNRLVLPMAGTAPTCDSGAKGAAYYNTTTLRLSVCNGIEWKVVGGKPVLVWTVNPLDYGPVTGSGVQKTATLRNDGDDTAASLAVALSGTGYTLDQNTCGTTLAPAATCTVKVTLGTAGGSGQRPGTITATATLASPALLTLAGSIGSRNCREIKQGNASAADGVYTIDPDGSGPLAALQTYCDMTTEGGGWTLIETANSARALSETAYWGTSAINEAGLAAFASQPNQMSRMSADGINAVCRAGDGQLRHRWNNNASGYWVTDIFAPDILPSLDIAYAIRGDSTYVAGFRGFGNGSLTVTNSGKWKRYNSFLSENRVCTGIWSGCGGAGSTNPYGPLCDTYGCDKPGQRTIEGHFWWPHPGYTGVPTEPYATYGAYGSRWCR